MWMMGYYLLTGRGFWSPVGYMGHFLLRNPDVTSPLQVAAGLMLHMMVSVGLGVTIAALLPALPRATSAGRGMAIALAIWALTQYGVLGLLDRVAFEGIVPWAFAVGHLLYGGMLGLVTGMRAGERVSARSPTAS
jgi:hypothetical protein